MKRVASLPSERDASFSDKDMRDSPLEPYRIGLRSGMASEINSHNFYIYGTCPNANTRMVTAHDCMIALPSTTLVEIQTVASDERARLMGFQGAWSASGPSTPILFFVYIRDSHRQMTSHLSLLQVHVGKSVRSILTLMLGLVLPCHCSPGWLRFAYSSKTLQSCA